MEQTAIQQMIDFINNINDNDSSEFNYYYDPIIGKLNELLEVEKQQLNIARLDGINLANKGYGSKNTSDLPNVNPDDVIPSSPQFVRQTLI